MNICNVFHFRVDDFFHVIRHKIPWLDGSWNILGVVFSHDYRNCINTGRRHYSKWVLHISNSKVIFTLLNSWTYSVWTKIHTSRPLNCFVVFLCCSKPLFYHHHQKLHLSITAYCLGMRFLHFFFFLQRNNLN